MSSSATAENNPTELYKRNCAELQVKCNSGLLSCLPNEPNGWANVRHLDFSRNCLGWNGVRPVLRAVFASGMCLNLESIVLSHNNLSNDSVAELYQLLVASPPTAAKSSCDVCPHLHTIDLSQNPISSPAGKLLSRLADQRAALRRIVVDDTLMNAGLSRLIAWKCAKKSPRYPGLMALSMAAVELRGTHAMMSNSSSSSRLPTSTELACAPLQAAALTTQRDASREGFAADEPCSSASASALQSSHHRITSSHNLLANTPSSIPSIPSTTKRVGGSPHLTAAAAACHNSAAAVAEGGAGDDVEWSAMETIWNLAAVAAPPEDGGWSGLAAVMALVRQDVSIASMY